MSRLIRLRHVLGALQSGRFTNLGELAVACGYSDQPHLIRDFKALIARLPGESGAFLQRRLSREETHVIHRFSNRAAARLASWGTPLPSR